MKSFRNVVDGEVRFSIPANSPCPCGSGKYALRCCLTSTGFRKVSASTVPPPPKTGNPFERCYASPLSDCNSKCSREHYFSESLLHYLNRNNELRVGGLPWVKGEAQAMPPSALTSRVLCDRHNSALSPLDAIAVRLFKSLDEEGAAGSGQQLLYLFSGHDLERWLLKILCGITYSRNLLLELESGPAIPKSWLDILFGSADFLNEQGLYVCKTLGHRFEGPHGLQLRAIAAKGQLTGIGLWVCGYELVLSMSGFPSRYFDGREFVYRPLELYTTGRDFEKSIIFSWDGGIADLGTVSCEIN